MYLIIPIIAQKSQVDIRTKTVNIEPQETVTVDSVTIRVNAALTTTHAESNIGISITNLVPLPGMESHHRRPRWFSTTI